LSKKQSESDVRIKDLLRQNDELSNSVADRSNELELLKSQISGKDQVFVTSISDKNTLFQFSCLIGQVITCICDNNDIVLFFCEASKFSLDCSEMEKV